MAGKEISIEYLPEWILEEIFSYLQDKKVMRLVSKNFKDIVDNSPKLMSNYWIKIKAKDLKDSNNVVNYFYQNIKIKIIPDDLEIINQYNWAKHVKSLRMDFVGENLIKSFDLLQSTLFSSDNLQEIFIDILYHPLSFMPNSGIQKPTFKSLKKLSVAFDFGNTSRIFDLFTDSPNLKKLSIHRVARDQSFLNEGTIWKLEELELSGTSNFTESFDKFLKKQSNTLKVLKIESLSIDRAKTLPNLEILHLNYYHRSDLNSRTKNSNDTLRVFLYNNTSMDSQALQEFLLHYNNIEQLYMNELGRIEFKDLDLSNLKHISVTPTSSELLWRLKMDNLKSLTHAKPIDINLLDRIPTANLKNVEELKIGINDYYDISIILRLFPALKDLYLVTHCPINEGILRYILKTKCLRSINITKKSWKLKISPMEFLSLIGNEKLIIKSYDSFRAMLENFEDF